MTAAQFVEAWKGRGLSERESAQPHFIQLCELLDVPAPYENRADDENYRFDAITQTGGSWAYREGAKAARTGRSKGKKGDTDPALFGEPATEGAEPANGGDGSVTRIVSEQTPGRGFADVWKRGHFCWEYKRQGVHADLAGALRQLKEYKDSLDNPPLLVVCDIDHFEIHTNFTGYPTQVTRFRLEDLAQTPQDWRDRGISPLQALRYVFTNPEWFRPKRTVNAITEEVAKQVGALAVEIGKRKGADGKKHDPHDVAHFLMQIVFTLFAEDVDLLPRGLVTEIFSGSASQPDQFHRQILNLFKTMEGGGDFGTRPIDWFNGGLFKDVDAQRIPRLTAGEIGAFSIAAREDWSAIEPSILGTLFERSLDPEKRSQIGAHYTSRDDIMLIVGPVVMEPLRREWEAAQRRVGELIGEREGGTGGQAARGTQSRKSNGARAADGSYPGTQSKIEAALRAFSDRLASVRILDPACGSGNFLYVAIQRLLDLEKEVIAFGARPEVGVAVQPRVKPTQLLGIELNAYAAELARISIWIGYLKWQRENGIVSSRRPILDALDTIENRDAILDLSDPKRPVPARWPEAEFIIGNPPFLGTKMLRSRLGDEYVEQLFTTYRGRIPGFSDFCCYWFELAREAVERRPSSRVGLLATQAIRNGAARRVLERIKHDGDIFMAWSDREWTLDGAAVQVSMIGFDNGTESNRVLDGRPVEGINADLSTGQQTSSAGSLTENANIGFVGDVKGGPFDIDLETAMRFLATPSPNGRRVSDVVREYTNGLDVTRRSRAVWVIDFGSEMDKQTASGFGSAFDYVERLVKPMRTKGRPTRTEWWLHMRPCPGMREAVEPLSRYVATPTLTKHRLFDWMSGRTLPDHQLVVFARSDDYFFGVLHSCVHELWARRMGTQLREVESGFRYTPTTCFETFSMPWAPGEEPVNAEAKGVLATASLRPLPASKTQPLRHGGSSTFPKGRGGRSGADERRLWNEISEAAAELDRLRENWLNPPEWIEGVERQAEITYREELANVPQESRDLVKRSAVMALAAKDKNLKQRTLTNLYNERPAWLRHAHLRLDRAVLAAYAAVDPDGQWDPEWAAAYEPFGAGEITIKERSKRSKKGRGAVDDEATRAAKQTAIEARKPIDGKILANLLRMNQERAGK